MCQVKSVHIFSILSEELLEDEVWVCERSIALLVPYLLYGDRDLNYRWPWMGKKKDDSRVREEENRDISGTELSLHTSSPTDRLMEIDFRENWFLPETIERLSSVRTVSVERCDLT